MAPDVGLAFLLHIHGIAAVGQCCHGRVVSAGDDPLACGSNAVAHGGVGVFQDRRQPGVTGHQVCAVGKLAIGRWRAVGGVVGQTDERVGAWLLHGKGCAVDGAAVTGLVNGGHLEGIGDGSAVGVLPSELVPWVLRVAQLNRPFPVLPGRHGVGAVVNGDLHPAAGLRRARQQRLNLAGDVILQPCVVARIECAADERTIWTLGVDDDRPDIRFSGIAGPVGHTQADRIDAVV